jgi:hypothetical protein
MNYIQKSLLQFRKSRGQWFIVGGTIGMLVYGICFSALYIAFQHEDTERLAMTIRYIIVFSGILAVCWLLSLTTLWCLFDYVRREASAKSPSAPAASSKGA